MINKANRLKIFLKYFFLILFTVTLISFFIMLFIESKTIKAKADEIRKEEKLFIAVEKELFTETFDIIISDLEYLRETFGKENYIINQYWRTFSDKNKIYNQIRFIDKDGKEKNKINYNKKIPYVIPSNYFQNKKDEDFFIETSQLKDGQIYVAQLSVSSEQGEPFTSLNPEILFCTPVYKNNVFQGIIVLNYNAKYLLYKISNISINSGDSYIYVLDDKGNLLYSNNLEHRWGLLKANKKNSTFASCFPYEWDNMGDNGDVLTENGLFTYTEVTIKDRYGLRGGLSPHRIFFSKEKWKIVSYIKADSKNGYYILNDIISIAKNIIKTKYYNLLYMAILAFIITLLIIENKVYMLKIKYIYEYDPMTDVYNRRAGFIRLDKCISNIIFHKSITLCFIDVNGLKEVNDMFGHTKGDELLLTVVEKIKENIRDNDFIIRLGGDEFLIALPKINKEQAETVWARVLKSYDNINVYGDRPYMISVSHGMAEINSIINKDTLDKLITIADDKMYKEKRLIKQTLQIIR